MQLHKLFKTFIHSFYNMPTSSMQINACITMQYACFNSKLSNRSGSSFFSTSGKLIQLFSSMINMILVFNYIPVPKKKYVKACLSYDDRFGKMDKLIIINSVQWIPFYFIFFFKKHKTYSQSYRNFRR